VGESGHEGVPAHGFMLDEPTELCEVVGESGHEGVPAHGFMLDEPTELCEVVD
jgi:hypothetical protein